MQSAVASGSSSSRQQEFPLQQPVGIHTCTNNNKGRFGLIPMFRTVFSNPENVFKHFRERELIEETDKVRLFQKHHILFVLLWKFKGQTRGALFGIQ